MSMRFIDRLSEAIAACRPAEAHLPFVWRAFADTLAAAAAGFAEEPVRGIVAAHAGTGALAWSGEPCDGAETAVMLNGLAAHAIDYDDVLMGGSLHASAVIVPAILGSGEAIDPDRLACAYAAGLLAARATSERVGRGHRKLGWHGTGVFGAIAAAAAAARLRGFDPVPVRSTLAVAAGQAGGLQLNFGTLAKPCQAGFAAAAGFRSARLVAAGVDGSPDIFARRGFADLYGAGDGVEEPGDEFFLPRPDLIALKLYPCCYGGHRLIGAVLDARKVAHFDPLDPSLSFRAIAASGGLHSLPYDRPDSGLQAKFSARHAVAVTLLEGAPRIEHFTDGSIHRADIRTVADRIEISEDAAHPSGGLSKGYARIIVSRGGELIADVERTALPGSPQDPPPTDALSAKIDDCLSTFRAAYGRAFAPWRQMSAVAGFGAWSPSLIRERRDG